MFERFTDRARMVMALANQRAERLQQEYIEPEHILLTLLETRLAAHVLTVLEVNTGQMLSEMEQAAPRGNAADHSGKRAQSERAKEIVMRAIQEARGLNQDYVGTEHLLLGLISDQGTAGEALLRAGVTIERARAAVLKIRASDSLVKLTELTSANNPAQRMASERYTDRARKTLTLANGEAQRLKHEYIGTEHLLLGLVKEGGGVGVNVLKILGVSLRKITLEVERLVEPMPEMVPMEKLPLTPRANQALQFAVEEAVKLNHNYIGTEHLLLGLLCESDGVAAQVLRGLGLTLKGTRDAVRQLLCGDPLAGKAPHDASLAAGPSGAEKRPPLVSDCPLCTMIKSLELGTHPAFVAALPECWVVLGDSRGCIGWCLLIYKSHVENLAELSIPRQQGLWRDVARVAAAIQAVFPKSGKDGGPPRINYECLGDQSAHVHWHVIPRHADDPESRKPGSGWPKDELKGSTTESERRSLAEQLRVWLTG